MRRVISLAVLSLIAVLMLSTVTFAGNYSNYNDCPYGGRRAGGSKGGQTMPMPNPNKPSNPGKGFNRGEGKSKKEKEHKREKKNKRNKSKKGGGNKTPKVPKTPQAK